jgi:hypothetical protein
MDRRATDGDIAQAVDDGRILRTHVLRPTWHFVTPADIRWMLDLTAPRVRQRMAIYARNTSLDATTVSRSLAIFERALGDGQYLIRGELGARLTREGISAKGIRLALLTMFAELEGLICSGPYRSKQLTYALLAERAPNARVLPRDEALAELARRYFRSHGPATIRDFVWWSGLTTTDAKRGVEMAGATREVIDGLTYSTVEPKVRGASGRRTIHMLPVYDEYLVAYRDRAAVPHAWMRPSTKNKMIFQHAIVADGQVAGTWRSSQSRGEVVVEIAPLKRFSRSDQQNLSKKAGEYGRFLGRPISLIST